MAFAARTRIFGDRGQIGGSVMAGTTRKSGAKEVPPSEIKDDLSRLEHDPRFLQRYRIGEKQRACGTRD
jgi:hypothetical protein